MIPPPKTDTKVPIPPAMLPLGRGEPQTSLLDLGGLPAVSVNDALGAVQGAVELPNLGGVVPSIDPGGLLAGLSDVKLPAIDLSPVTSQVGGVVDKVVQTVDSTVATVKAVAAGVSIGHQRQTTAAAAIPPTPVTFRLTTTANGVTQTFTLPLCVPTPINITSTALAPATTIVSLCPVPLALTNAVVTPPPGQPFQLYLSVQRIAGTPVIPATFLASYTVDSATGTSITVTFGIRSVTHSYPGQAIVGAATDYNPATGGAASHLTMGWATDSPTDALSIGAAGTGTVEISALPADSGSFALSYENGKFTSHLMNTGPFASGSNPAITLSAPIPGTANSSATVRWTQIAQDFVFNITPTMVDARPRRLRFDGSQPMGARNNFSVQFDFFTAGALVGRYVQNGLGANFTVDLGLTYNADNDITGIELASSAGTPSTAYLSGYEGGQLAGFAEFVGLPSGPSHVSVQTDGSPRTANAGATLTGTTAPAFVGMASFMLPDGTVSAVPQATISLPTTGSLPALPFAIPGNAAVAVAGKRVNPDFEIVLKQVSSGTSASNAAGGLDAHGSTPTASRMADQLIIDALADSNHRATFVMNALSQQWTFNTHLHGTTDMPTGFDLTDNNVPAISAEMKQIVYRTTSGQVLYTLTIDRPGSSYDGYTPPAGATVRAYDPPSSFSLAVDYAKTSSNGVCQQGVSISGAESAASPGYLTLSANGLNLQLLNEFVAGKWGLEGVAAGPSATCRPDSFSFTVHQDAGGNPNGELIGTTDVGQIRLRSFATTTHLEVKEVFDEYGGSAGARVDGTNSEPNPGQQIHLDQYRGAELTKALNIWATVNSQLHTGTQGTATVGNIPQNFGIQIAASQGQNGQTLQIDSYNTGPAPNEFVQIDAPAGPLAPGGDVHTILRSLDTHTHFLVHMTRQVDGTLNASLSSSNVNANPTEVFSAYVRNVGGAVVYALLLARPAAAIGGFPTSSTTGTITWTNMPQTYDLHISGRSVVNGPASNGSLDVTIANASETPESVLRLVQSSTRQTLVFYGTGASQTFHADYSQDGTGASGQLNARGTIPSSLKYIQAYRITGDFNDQIFKVYRSGTPEQPSTQRGTEVSVFPYMAQTDFSVAAKLNGSSSISVGVSQTQTGGGLLLQQYYQPSNHASCTYAGWPYPCAQLVLDNLPMQASLTMNLPDPTSQELMPAFGYSATDDSLYLQIDSLLPNLMGGFMINNVPRHGLSMTAHRGTCGNVALTLAPNVPTERMPFMYMHADHVAFREVCPQHLTITGHGLPAGVSVSGKLTAVLSYEALIQLSADAGLSRVDVVPVVDKDDKDHGLIGVQVNGPGHARFSLGLTMGLVGANNSISWDWEAHALGVRIAYDSGTYSWPDYPIPNYGEGFMGGYSWEVVPNDSRRFAGTGCSGSNAAVVNSNVLETWLGSATIPFQIPFPELNNGFSVCGGHVMYWQLSPQDFAFKHCPGYQGCANPYSWGRIGGTFGIATISVYSDWILFDAMKVLYSSDPLQMTQTMSS